MLRRLRSTVSSAPGLTAGEAAATDHAAAAWAAMQQDLGETGLSSCDELLGCLESMACALNLDAADRSYRGHFSANYRALFPDSARRYRTDVLEASADQQASIWVNGDKFELSPEAMDLAGSLQHAWTTLGAELDRWRRGPADVRERPTRQELCSYMQELDAAWAKFEEQYVTELIAIEERARQVLVRAIELEASMRRLGVRDGGGSNPKLREAQHRLIACIAKLNAVANFKRKGRDDLGGEILDSAQAVLRKCDAAGGNAQEGDGDNNLLAARCLAADVVESFEAVCKYLRDVGRCLERVDPHLCNNAGLVARLVDWEESWEIGAKYVCDSPLLHSICDTVTEVRMSQELSPTLQEMFEDCDAELFLVLPRLVWLYYIAEPTRPRAALVRHLLPHRFSQGSASSPVSEIQGFIDHFGRVEERLGRGRRKALERLTKRAVAGSFEVAEKTPKSETAALQHRAVEGLMRELEGWSLELQRHCAEDWNQCSALVVQCLQSVSEKKRSEDAFHV